MDVDGLFIEYANAAKADALAAKAGAIGIINMASRPKKLLYRFIASDGYDHGLINLVMGREDAKRCQRVLRAGGKLDFSATLDVASTHKDRVAATLSFWTDSVTITMFGCYSNRHPVDLCCEFY